MDIKIGSFNIFMHILILGVIDRIFTRMIDGYHRWNLKVGHVLIF